MNYLDRRSLLVHGPWEAGRELGRIPRRWIKRASRGGTGISRAIILLKGRPLASPALASLVLLLLLQLPIFDTGNTKRAISRCAWMWTRDRSSRSCFRWRCVAAAG